MPIALADLLQENQVALDLRATTEAEALREIIGTLAGNPHVVDLEAFYREVLAREQQHSTAMGNGVAFPHARTDQVKEIVLAIGRSRAGIPVTNGSELLHLIFVIGTPKPLVSDYLVCIGALARLLKSDTVRAPMLVAETVPEFLAPLRPAS